MEAGFAELVIIPEQCGRPAGIRERLPRAAPEQPVENGAVLRHGGCGFRKALRLRSASRLEEGIQFHQAGFECLEVESVLAA